MKEFHFQKDTLICPICKGRKVIINEDTQRMDLCPRCNSQKEEIQIKPQLT